MSCPGCRAERYLKARFAAEVNFASGRPSLRLACRATCAAPLGRRDDAMWGGAHRDRRLL